MSSEDYFPNAVEVMGKTWHVAQSHPDASDDNPGTEDRPFKTITQAASVVDMGDAVVIDEGIYREEVPLVRNGHQYQPASAIVFKAAPGKRVYLKGSDVFEPDWQDLGGGVYQAKLPGALFAENAYNPYALSCVIGEPEAVRPCDGSDLPETLGQIYVDGEALEQLTDVDAVRETPGSFVVSADGRSIVVHFANGKLPTGRLVELTVRERCFRPQFPGPVFINTTGMVVEHAANPGPFCFGRPLTIRRNKNTGITVRKTFCLRSTIKSCGILGQPAYRSKDDPTIISCLQEDALHGSPQAARLWTVESADGGKTWTKLDELSMGKQSLFNHFLDDETGKLLRHCNRYEGLDLDGAFGARRHETVLEVSPDGGKAWGEPEVIDRGNYYFRIIKLQDGRLFWPFTDNMIEGRHHSRFNCLLGTWRDDLSGIDWERGGSVEVEPERCSSGLDEPQACPLPDGRIFVLLRAGNILPTQDRPGVPSVKLFIVSGDGGRTWTEPTPLTDEDGKYVYSPRSYPDVIRSSKNGKVYVLFNISGSTVNCDPRTTLDIAELNPDTLCMKRDTVAVVETKHPEHHHLIRYSNWMTMEDRATRNLLLFMKLHMSEYCPVRKGYDFSVYRYGIDLPQ